MKNKLPIQSFLFKNNEVRGIFIDNEPWFVLKDICNTLGLINPSNWVSVLDKEDLYKIEVSHFSGNSWDGNKITLINESALYQIIFQSNKPEAKEFKRWVTSEVLPSIRKTGSYSFGNKIDDEKHCEVYKALQALNKYLGATKPYHYINLAVATKGKNKNQSLNIRGKTLVTAIDNLKQVEDYKKLRVVGKNIQQQTLLIG